MSDRQRDKGFCLYTYEGRILYPFVGHSYNQQRYIKNLKYPKTLSIPIGLLDRQRVNNAVVVFDLAPGEYVDALPLKPQICVFICPH